VSSGSGYLRTGIITNVHKLLFAAKNISRSILDSTQWTDIPQTYIKAHQSRCKSTLRTRLRSIPTQLPPPYSPHRAPLTVLPSPCSPHPAPLTLLPSPCSPHPAPLTLLPLVSPLHSHPSHAPSNKSSRHPVISLLVSLVPVLTCSQGTKTLVLVVSVLVHVLYLNLDVQRPMTSPWHTSSALNSDPSSVR
jgi:hypothetical protein